MTEEAMQKAQPEIHTTDATLTRANRWDHFLARWGVNRGGHRVPAGLYRLGEPTLDSPVFVTANYTLSFDALRSALPGVDGYILVLDTGGVNVWCAAGKGTFGTDELVSRLESSHLAEVVSHRNLILPQLGATGVAAHEVKPRSGWRVEYGPVRAADLPEYLKTRQATPEMRRVRFGLWDRLVLIPVEVVHTVWPTLLGAAILYLLAGWLTACAAIAAVGAGTVLFPLLLPWLPTPNFTSKGFSLGVIVGLPFAVASAVARADAQLWHRIGWAVAFLLTMPPVTAYLALNFTGSTPFTSPTGVAREISAYTRPLAALFAVGLLLAVVLIVVRFIGGI